MKKFKIGDRVIGRNYHKISGKTGTVINIPHGDCISVEFDEHINGHDCPDSVTVKGKPGHCWNCDLYELELIDKEPKYEIY